MSQYDDEQLVSQAFACFTADAAPAIHAPAAGVVRQTAIKRNRNRVTLAAIGAVLAVMLPVGVSLGAGRGDRDPGIATGFGTSVTITSSGSPVSSPTTSPRPDGPIRLSELTASAVSVPPWPWSGSGDVTCDSGEIRLQPPGEVRDSQIVVVEIVQTNLDGDVASETAALLRCGYGAEQIVAFDRDVTGTISTLGQVIATTVAMPAIITMAAQPEGGVTATVADSRTASDQLRQDRTYAWTDGQFVQVDGLRAFPSRLNPVDLGLTVATPMPGAVSQPCDGALRDVSVTFTVTNHSRHTSGRFHLYWRGGAFLPNGSYESPDWLDSPGDPAKDGGHRALKRGETVHLTFKFKIDACVTDWGFTTEIRSDTPDPKESNNLVTWWLRIR